MCYLLLTVIVNSILFQSQGTPQIDFHFASSSTHLIWWIWFQNGPSCSFFLLRKNLRSQFVQNYSTLDQINPVFEIIVLNSSFLILTWKIQQIYKSQAHIICTCQIWIVFISKYMPVKTCIELDIQGKARPFGRLNKNWNLLGAN